MKGLRRWIYVFDDLTGRCFKVESSKYRIAESLALAAKQVVTAADAMENGGRGCSKADHAHYAMVKAEGELLLAEALAEWERKP